MLVEILFLLPLKEIQTDIDIITQDSITDIEIIDSSIIMEDFQQDIKDKIELEEIEEIEEEDFKKKKRELIDNKTKLTGDMEKEKQQLIVKFESAFKKKNQINAEIVKDLFPEDEELYNRIKKMTDKINDINELVYGQSASKTIGSEDKKDDEKVKA